MSFSYTGDPSSSTLDETRFILGDTDENSPELSDEELMHLLQQQNDNPLGAAVYAATGIAAKYAGKRNRSIGPISESYDNQFRHWTELASILMDRFRWGIDGKGLQADGTRRSAAAELFGGGKTYLGPDDSPLTYNEGEGTEVT